MDIWTDRIPVYQAKPFVQRGYKYGNQDFFFPCFLNIERAAKSKQRLIKHLNINHTILTYGSYCGDDKSVTEQSVQVVVTGRRINFKISNKTCQL